MKRRVKKAKVSGSIEKGEHLCKNYKYIDRYWKIKNEEVTLYKKRQRGGIK